ncbi:MAG TPA: winged helix-turn-helix domain-containing protein [Woeseiaceae bacterium]|nr:winged helix-turn-helix domain-containing protein [Woeseiaceae bacterium]
MALTSEQLRQGFLAGDRLVEPALNRVSGPDGVAQVEPRVMTVLVCLAGHAGDVVSRATLYDAVWGKALVSDQALTNCISELRRLFGDDRAEPRYIETVPKRGYRLVAPIAAATARPRGDHARPSARRLRALSWGALAVLAAAVVAVVVWPERGAGRYEALPTVVTLPFENAAGDASLDYLRLALADEITTLLTQAPDIAVRPFEPRAANAEQASHAGHVVSGHYYLEEGERLAIAIEALDVEHQRLVWRARITVPAGDLLAMRERIAERVSGGLLPALGAAPESTMPHPSDAAAYRLYLNSLAISRDAGPNLQGIRMLEKAVRLDPGFASAWAELARRHHDDASYGDGGEAARQRARDAAVRALAEDAGNSAAAQELILLQTEAGHFAAAYRQARDLVDRRGRSAYAHFALSFVLRYVGMLAEAERHCDIALALDPGNFGWRTCALAFMADGKLRRAREFIALHEGSEWSNLVGSYLEVREGDRAGALDYARSLSPDGADRRFLVACLTGSTGTRLNEAAAAFIQRWRSEHDPEPAYHTAALLAYCGRREDALDLLGYASKHGFCTWPALDRDPIWSPLTENSRFRGLREEGIACRERFIQATGLAGGS